MKIVVSCLNYWRGGHGPTTSFHWSAVGKNNRIVAISCTIFKTYKEAYRSASRFANATGLSLTVDKECRV